VRQITVIGIAIVFAALPTQLQAQRNPKKEAAFVKAHPAVGDSLPEIEVYSPDGKPFGTANLRGHFTVLTFGCLT